MAHRFVEVSPERLPGWAERFAAGHGGSTVEVGREVLRLVGADGATADLEVPWPPADLPTEPHDGAPSAGTPAAAVVRLAEHAARPRTALLLLVRRGGYGAGLARDGRLLDHAVGTRYVQGRTAAGGWSQQRFARRRSGQAAALGGAAAEAVARVLGRVEGADHRPQVLVPGGDRGLVDDVLADPRLRSVAELPRGPLLDVRDPRLVVLQDVADRARRVRVRVTDAPTG
ncbi:acVLRF1 family peptidyl-tRNA hydrolase [Thalassiella azotivora]